MTGLLLSLLLQAAPAAPLPCNSDLTPCMTTESLALALRAWSPGATDPRNLAGGALQAEIHYKRWRFQGQIIGTATSGYEQGDLSTVRDVEAHLVAGLDLLRLPGGVSIGPMLAIGGAAALPEGGNASAVLPKTYSLLAGLQASRVGGARIHLGFGSAHPLDRGAAIAAKWQIPLSPGGRVFTMGYVAVGRRNIPASGDVPASSGPAIAAWTAVGVRL